MTYHLPYKCYIFKAKSQQIPKPKKVRTLFWDLFYFSIIYYVCVNLHFRFFKYN